MENSGMSGASGDMSGASGDTHVNDAHTLGAILQGAREASGESIEEVSLVLRINWRYLQALEEGKFDELPGAAYAIGFIRTYADYLNIDSADLIVQYKELNGTSHVKSSLVFPEPMPESGFPGGGILFAGIIVAVVAYGGWYLATEEDSLLTRMIPQVPEQLAEMTAQSFPGDSASDTVAVEEAAPQPSMAETPKEASAQPSEEMPEQPTDDPAPGGEVAEVVSTEPQPALQAEPQDDVAVVAETATEPVIETITEVASSDTVKTPSVAAEEEGTSVPGTAVATEIPSMVEENQAVVTDPVQEQVVEETHEVVAEETVTEASEGSSFDAITEEPVADVQEAATVQEDNDALALNEEQLLAVQASIGSNEPLDGSTNDVITEELTAVEPVAMPEPVVESITEIVAEEPTAVIADQNSDVDAGTSATGSDDNQVVAIPVEEPMTETASGRVYGDEGAVRIIVRAKTNSWIQVRDDIAGQLLLTRLLRAGDEYHVPDRDGLSLLTGNAGALEFLVDGEQVPAIGRAGDVRRNVLLDADRLKSGDATSN